MYRQLVNLQNVINNRLENEHLKHVQCLIRKYKGVYSIKLVSIDIAGYKERVKAICNDFCESIYLVDETKTTLVYSI